jgi:type VI protein secretion system component VasK
VLLAFGLSILAVVAVGGAWLHLSTKKLLAAQAHEFSVLQAAVTEALLELRELRARLEKAEKSEKKAAAFGDNFDANANADADEAQGNLSKLERTIRDRKAMFSPIKK